MPDMELDRFYVNRESVDWIYYNPDSVAGGQFVHNTFDLDLLQSAMQRMTDVDDAFDYIGSQCEQYCVDVGTPAFDAYLRAVEEDEPFALHCTLETLKRIRYALLRASV